MGDMTNSTAEKTPKRSWFKGIKTEFNKIVWPDKESLTKKSIAVIIVTIITGIIIYVLDWFIELGIGVIIG